MAEEQRQKETEIVQEFKLEQDNEFRFEVESKEKVTLEVFIRKGRESVGNAMFFRIAYVGHY